MKLYTLLFLLLLIAMPSFAKTKSIDKPLVLFIHGGPASPLILFSRGFDSAFIKDFLVVHWDQRQSGKSYDPTQPLDTFSAQQVAKDGLAVVEHLKKKFGILSDLFCLITKPKTLLNKLIFRFTLPKALMTWLRPPQ